MRPKIPFDNWQPLSVAEVKTLFVAAPFVWGLAGGYAVEQYLGREIRDHGDIDVIVFRDAQLAVQHWLDGWQLYAAQPPGSLRLWQHHEFLPFGVHNIWGHRVGSKFWQLQLMFMEGAEKEWFSRRNATIRGRRDDLIVEYRAVPCLRVEVQLLYKAKNNRPKDDVDFQACLPHLNTEAKQWLVNNLKLQHPNGHVWLNVLKSFL